jgi:hypothetical protein
MLFWSRIKVILGASLYLTAVACHSAKSNIDGSARDIGANANKTIIIAEEIANNPQENDNVHRANLIIDFQTKIIESASEIRTELHGVENTTPWWANTLRQISVAIIIVGIILLLWQTGIGLLIKKAFWAIGLFIPTRAMRSAEVDIKTQRDKNPLSFNETIAVRRTSDPAYEYARRKIKKEQGK